MMLYQHTWPTPCPELPSQSIDAIVTDPPYEINMMARAWDRSGIAYNVDLWRELLRIAKPGAHLLAFGGGRTYHRMVCAIEDAGWQIRDQLAFLHGQGFPKSLDISKAIDAAAGADREVKGTYKAATRSGITGGMNGSYANEQGHTFASITSPATPEPQAWQGWGTALKPAFEPIIYARKPLTLVPESDRIIVETTLLLEAFLWSIAPARLVAGISTLSPNVFGGGLSGSVRWLAAVLHGLQSPERSALMATFNSLETAQTYWSIASLWNSILDAHYSSANKCTTAMASGLTTGLRILNCLLLTSMPDTITKVAYHHAGLWSDVPNAVGSLSGNAPGWTHIPVPSASEPASAHTTAGVHSVLANIAADLSLPHPRINDDSAAKPAPTDTVTDYAGSRFSPAFEPIVLARAPFTGTVAANVLQHGTGGLNIDGCRIGTDPAGWGVHPSQGFTGGLDAYEEGGRPVIGRWPANLLLDEHAAALLDAQGGERSSGYMAAGTPRASTMGFNGAMPDFTLQATYGDSGGASRFFYVAKPSRLERDAGLWDLPHQSAAELTNRQPGSAGLQSPRAGAGSTSGGHNSHPTVKPLELMRYLVRLITPPGGTVLDPFMGSGTTGMACMLEGVDFIGIDQEAEYVELARRRIAYIEQAMRYGTGAIEKPPHRARGQMALTFNEVVE